MNMKTLSLGIVAVAVIIGTIFLLNNKSGGYKTNQSTGNQGYQNQPTNAPTTEVTKTAASPSGAMMEEKNTVTLTKNGFNPQILTIKAGTKVTWLNKSGGVATVDSANHPTHLVYPALNLGKFNDGESLSLTFDKTGAYRYHDHFNPSRFGTIVVD